MLRDGWTSGGCCWGYAARLRVVIPQAPPGGRSREGFAPGGPGQPGGAPRWSPCPAALQPARERSRRGGPAQLGDVVCRPTAREARPPRSGGHALAGVGRVLAAAFSGAGGYRVLPAWSEAHRRKQCRWLIVEPAKRRDTWLSRLPSSYWLLCLSLAVSLVTWNQLKNIRLATAMDSRISAPTSAPPWQTTRPLSWLYGRNGYVLRWRTEPPG